MGRTSAYTGKAVTWDEILNSTEPTIVPAKLEWGPMPTPRGGDAGAADLAVASISVPRDAGQSMARHFHELQQVSTCYNQCNTATVGRGASQAPSHWQHVVDPCRTTNDRLSPFPAHAPPAPMKFASA